MGVQYPDYLKGRHQRRRCLAGNCLCRQKLFYLIKIKCRETQGHLRFGTEALDECLETQEDKATPLVPVQMVYTVHNLLPTAHTEELLRS
jgi:hypothetical protein